MGTRLHVVRLVLLSLVAGALGSLVAVGGTQQTAHACSVAGPSAEAWPTSGLRPGQTVEVSGRSFYEIVFWDATASPDPALVAQQPPVSSCDFDLVPMTDLAIVWHGGTTQKLGVVDGPDFRTTVTVPAAAQKGPAALEVGGVWIDVHVGPVIDPPPPCPLASADAVAARPDCPEPWPCPVAAQAVAGGPDVAPGYPPPCPEPCADAHTAQGTVTNRRGDCPPPCAVGGVDPGSTGGAAAAIRCPDPCAAAAAAAAAVWCPDPCPRYATSPDGVAHESPALVWPPHCPDPCASAADAAVWCPDPCPVYATASGEAIAQPVPDRCPDPCGQVSASAIWCPPERPLPDPPAIDTGSEANVATAAPAAVTTAPGPPETGAADLRNASDPAAMTDDAIRPEVAHARNTIVEVSHRIVATLRRVLGWTR